MKKIITYISLLYVFTAFSQSYTGGIGDGFGMVAYTETQSIFKGGIADGFSTSGYTESQSIFTGGIADGFSTSGYTETQSIFKGGIADGFSTSGYTENNSIFTGGIADGFSSSGYTENNSIFTGGIADGFSTSGYTENNSIFTGGIADGFSSSGYTENNSIFTGGVADGFSMSLYDENPLCSNNVTIWTGSSWTNGAPDATTQVILDGFYETATNGNLNACFAKVEQSSDFIINSNTYARIVTDFINNGLTAVKHQGSFVQVNENATSSGTGTFTVDLQTTPLDDPIRYTYFSSPLSNQDLTVFNSWAAMNSIWRFNESVQDWYLVNQNDTMIPGVGYIVRGAADTGQYPLTGMSTFNNGVFNSGPISYPLTYNPGGVDDDNALVGNPYPCAINAGELLADNPQANAFYFWTHKSPFVNGAYAGDDYAIWNSSGGIASASGSPAPTGFIASGQGFFVDATGPGTFTFKNAHRVNGNNNDFRRPESINRERIWINMYNEQGAFNQILVNFSENGTEHFDPKKDATRFFTGNAIRFYSLGLNNENFAIQALPILNEETVVPLGFEINVSDLNSLKIGIDHSELSDNVNVYLKDKALGKLHNLNISDYVFEDTQDIHNNRFELVFKRDALNVDSQENVANNIYIANYGSDQILINSVSGENISKIVMYDVIGKKLLDFKTNRKSVLISTQIKDGTVLIFKIQMENGTILSKRFIKF